MSWRLPPTPERTATYEELPGGWIRARWFQPPHHHEGLARSYAEARAALERVTALAALGDLLRRLGASAGR